MNSNKSNFRDPEDTVLKLLLKDDDDLLSEVIARKQTTARTPLCRLLKHFGCWSLQHTRQATAKHLHWKWVFVNHLMDGARKALIAKWMVYRKQPIGNNPERKIGLIGNRIFLNLAR